MSSVPDPSPTRVFRLPRSAYLIVLFLLFCTLPLAFATDHVYSVDDLSNRGTSFSGLVLGPRVLLLLIPVLAAFYIARTATVVGTDGIRIRALFGSRSLPWERVRGLSVGERAVYAVSEDGAVRLPCVRVADLANVSLASDGHLPALPQPLVKAAPSKRRRR